MTLDVNVIINIDSRFFPLREHIPLGRQGSERRPLQRFKPLLSGTGQLFERPLVQRLPQRSQAAVEFVETEERVVS